MQRQADGQTSGAQHGDHRGGLHADTPQHGDEGERQHAVAHDRRQEVCHRGVDATQFHHAVQRITDHAGHDRTDDQDNDGGDDIHRVLDQQILVLHQPVAGTVDAVYYIQIFHSCRPNSVPNGRNSQKYTGLGSQSETTA